MIVQRLRQNGKRMALDERLFTELFRLNLDGKLTLAQCAAGLRVAEIYGKFEGYKRKGRNTRSPSYNASYGETGVDEELLGEAGLLALEGRIRDATTAWQLLQDEFKKHTDDWKTLHNWVEELCVHDRHIGPVYLEIVRPFLQRLAIGWKLNAGGTGRQQQDQPQSSGRHGPPLHFNKHEQIQKTADETPFDTAPAIKRPNLDRIFFIEVTRMAMPDKTTDDLGAMYDNIQARKQREVFRRSKVVVLKRR